jgi:hypothetical protein
MKNSCGIQLFGLRLRFSTLVDTEVPFATGFFSVGAHAQLTPA